MPPWADHAAKLDAGVDLHLGDAISYNDGSGFKDIAGFVILAGDTAEYGNQQIDNISQVNRVRINKSLIVEPSQAHRLRHAKLGTGTFKPTNVEMAVQGRYWMFDVEKVSAA